MYDISVVRAVPRVVTVCTARFGGDISGLRYSFVLALTNGFLIGEGDWDREGIGWCFPAVLVVECDWDRVGIGWYEGVLVDEARVFLYEVIMSVADVCATRSAIGRFTSKHLPGCEIYF